MSRKEVSPLQLLRGGASVSGGDFGLMSMLQVCIMQALDLGCYDFENIFTKIKCHVSVLGWIEISCYLSFNRRYFSLESDQYYDTACENRKINLKMC